MFKSTGKDQRQRLNSKVNGLNGFIPLTASRRDDSLKTKNTLGQRRLKEGSIKVDITIISCFMESTAGWESCFYLSVVSLPCHTGIKRQSHPCLTVTSKSQQFITSQWKQPQDARISQAFQGKGQQPLTMPGAVFSFLAITGESSIIITGLTTLGKVSLAAERSVSSWAGNNSDNHQVGAGCHIPTEAKAIPTLNGRFLNSV